MRGIISIVVLLTSVSLFTYTFYAPEAYSNYILGTSFMMFFVGLGLEIINSEYKFNFIGSNEVSVHAIENRDNELIEHTTAPEIIDSVKDELNLKINSAEEVKFIENPDLKWDQDLKLKD